MKYWWKRKIYNLIHRTYKNNWNLFKTSGAAWIIVGQDLRHLHRPENGTEKWKMMVKISV